MALSVRFIRRSADGRWVMMCLRCGALLTYWPREIFTRGCPSCNRAWRFNGRTPGKEE